jgi:hypothetical protein
MPAVLLRITRHDALDADPQTQPPHRACFQCDTGLFCLRSRTTNEHKKGSERMRKLLLPLTGAAFLWSGIAAADHFTATCECGKPDSQLLLPAGDRPDHVLGVEALKCGWSKPLEIGGDKTKESVATEIVEVSGNKFHIRSGVHMLTMQSGDKVALPYQGSGTSRDNQESLSKGAFTFADGTGKLKGVKGKGTFSCKSAGEGVSCQVEGDYEPGK